MTTALSLIFIAFAILQIVLFFKIWIMTNDVRELKKEINGRNLYYYILKGDKSELKTFLNDKIYRELSYTYNRYLRSNASDTEYTDKYNHYKELYDRFEIEFPVNLIDLDTPSKFHKHVMSPKK